MTQSETNEFEEWSLLTDFNQRFCEEMLPFEFVIAEDLNNSN